MGPARAVLTVYAVYLAAAMSPGPAVFYVMRTAVASRRLGLRGALGVATGTTLWVSIAALGLTAALRHSPLLWNAVRLAGAAYLLLLAWRLARAGLAADDGAPAAGFAPKDARAAYAQGLATNATNPGTALFFTALLGLYGVERLPAAAQAAVYGGIPVLSLCWYGTLALAFSHERLAKRYLDLRRPLDAALALMFLFLAGKLGLAALGG